MKKYKLLLWMMGVIFLTSMSSSAWGQVSAPLTEDFEAGWPTAWTQDPATATTNWSVGGNLLANVNPFGGSAYLAIYATTQQSAVKAVLPLVDMTSATNPELSFRRVQKARGAATGYARDTLKVYGRTATNAPWLLLQTISAEAATWTLTTVDLSFLVGSNMQVALEYVFGGGMGIAIDNIRMGDPSQCIVPNNLHAYRVTDTSAELMWNAYEMATSYALKVSTTPLAAPSTQTADIFDQTVYFKPYTINGLTPSTTYYFYVSSDCEDGEQSGWSAAGEFRTQCSAVTLPYTQNFETGSDFLSCWTRQFVAMGDWNITPNAATYTPQLTTTAHLSAQAVSLYAYYDADDLEQRSIKSWIASPMLQADSLTDKQVSFWMYCNDVRAKLHIGVMGDPNDDASFEEIAETSVSSASLWEEVILPLNTITNQTARHIAVMVDGADNQDNYYILIDDFVVEDIPVCPRASFLKALNITDHDASITWLGVAPSWNIKVSTTALTNPDTDAADVLSTAITAAPYQLTGLNSMTHYFVYLQPNCSASGNGLGQWAGPLEFVTIQTPTTVPYDCDFETVEANQWQMVNGTQTNQWHVGTAAKNGGSKGLYISSDLGQTNYYATNMTSFVMAYRTIDFTPGTWYISFDWKGYGESSYDLMRAFLVPTDIHLEAGNPYNMAYANNGEPPRWISLSGAGDPGKLNGSTSWTTLQYQLTVTDTIRYNFVFFWKNDNAAGTNPPAAVDNIRITNTVCSAPTALTVDTVSTNMVGFSWTPSADGETAWDVEVFGGNTQVVDTTLNITNHTIGSLLPGTDYTIRVRSNCGAGATSAWISTTVRTDTLPDQCQSPTNFRVTHVGTDEVTIAWDCDSLTTAWDVAYGAEWFDPDAAGSHKTRVTTKTHTFTGLTPGTTYEVGLRSACDDGSTLSWQYILFTTMKTPATLPYNLGFETSEAESNNWEMSHSGGAAFCIGTSAHKTGAKAMYVSNNGNAFSYVGAGVSTAYAHRTFVVPAGSYTISFDWMGVGQLNNDFARAFLVPYTESIPTANTITATGAPTDWIALDGGSQMAGSSTWETEATDYNANALDTVTVVFIWQNDQWINGASSFAVDNFSFVPRAGCFPASPMTANVLGSSVTLGWRASDSTTYHVKVSETALANPEVANSEIDTIVGVDSLVLNDLTPSTTYYAYVKSDCDPTATWASVSFVTDCSAVRRIMEGFETVETNGLPACWSNGQVVGTFGLPSQDASSHHDGTHSVKFRGGTTFLATPPLSIDITTAELKFWLRGEQTASGSMVVGVMTDPTNYATFVPVDTILPTAYGVYEQQDILFAQTGLSGTGYSIAFVQQSNSFYWYWIDDVEIGESRNCALPTGVAANNLSATGATLSWNSAGTSHNVVIATASVDPDQVSETDADVLYVMTGVEDNPLDLSGLLASSTTYYIYIQADCNNGDLSLWSDEYQFTTLCGAQAVPYVQNFATTAVDATPNCWSALHSSNGVLPATNIYDPVVATLSDFTGDNKVLSISGYHGASGNSAGCAVMPLFASSIDTLMLTLSHRCGTGNARLLVGLMSDPSDLSSFSPIDTAYASGAWNTKIVKLGGYSSGNYVALMVDGDLEQSAATVYVDGIVVDTVVGCLAPTNLHIGNMSGTDTVTVDLAWNAGDNESAWEVVYGTTGFNPATSTPVAVSATSYTITNLIPYQVYDFYVRALCGNGQESEWVMISSMANGGTPRLPFVTDFENAANNTNWEFHNATTNAWYIGNATQSGGANALYISSDNGATNSYNVASTSDSYACRLLDLDGTAVTLSFDWKGYGETTYDYLRVYLVPSTFDFTNFSGYALNGVPANGAGFIAVDGGTKLNLSNNWVNKTVNFVAPVGEYYLVFAWHNDASDGIQPAAAIDNISFIKQSCYLTNTDVLALSNAMVVDAATDCPTVQLQVNNTTFTPGTAGLMIDTIVSLPFTINGLNPQSDYYVAMRGFCQSGDTTVWTTVGHYVTACEAVTVNDSTPFVETFDSYGTGNSVHPTCWTTGTNYTYIAYPYVSATAFSTPGSLCFYGNTSIYSYAATPEVAGTPLDQLRVRFRGYTTTATSAIEVGVMTNPADYSTFVAVQTITPNTLSTWEERTVDLASYTGAGKFVALRAPQGTSTYYYIDNFNLEIIPGCTAPTTTVNVAANTLDIQMTGAASAQAWEIIVSQSSTPDTVGAAFAGTTTSNSLAVPVQSSTTYYVHVRSLCEDNNTSSWNTTTVTTPCPTYNIPYAEDFSGQFPPTCWERYTGKLSDIWSGYTNRNLTFDGWRAAVNNFGITGDHARINVQTITHHWLQMPAIHIDTTAILAFDLALTISGTGNAILDPANQADDRFLVLASRDGGSTWNAADIVAEWNDAGSSRVYSNIPNHAQRIQLSLQPFQGQDIVLAFYAESTIAGGNNDIHIGNVEVKAVDHVVNIADHVCEGYDYTANGFQLLSTDLDVTSSPLTFSRISGDTIVVLTLTVTAAAETVFNDSICPGTTYTLNGFSVATPGTYHRYLTASDGCDSIVTLNLTYRDGFVDNQTVVLCDNELPYLWMGQSLTAAGSYTHTAASASGCDSLFTLSLVVNNSFFQTDSVVVMDANELPYEWNGNSYTTSGTYTIPGVTATGCDSVLTLVLDVRVGLDYAEEGMFALSPNPVHRGGDVRLDVTLSESERDGIVVEVFTSNGKLISRFEPKEQPMFVTMPEVDGLYMIRLTTGTGRVLYGKIIVK